MHHKGGFTLLEIMVSLAIMAIALITIIQLFSGALRSGRTSYEYSLAAMGAKEKMDEVMGIHTLEEFDELEKSGEFDDSLKQGYQWEIIGPEEFPIPEGLLTDVEEESGTIDDIPSRLYEIKVKVSWASGMHEKQISFSTIKMMEEEE
jgi:general secretion pathway protein I